MDLQTLLSDDAAGIERIAEALDAASASARNEAVLSLNRSQQRTLYRKAAASPALDLEHFVPRERASLQSVSHRGKNTLPMPRGLQLFEKRFCRPQDGSNRLFGYNESPFINVIGPGFFVGITTDGDAAWQQRGSMVFDYFQVPDGPVADGWPRVVPNTYRLQRFVYHRTRDFMRRVSRHVSIGTVYRAEKPLHSYFVLVRQD